MATYPASSDVVSGTPILASQMNNLRKDAIYGGQSPGDAVSLISMLRRFSQNVRLQFLAPNKVRVPFAADKPPCLMVGDYMLAATANVDSAAITGTAGPRYVLAQRTAGSSTFTLVISTSSVEGADQRLVGELYFDGTNVKQASIKSYELERPGYVYAGNEAQRSSAPAQGDLFIALDTRNVFVCFTAGVWSQIGGSVFGVGGTGIKQFTGVGASGLSDGNYGSYQTVQASLAEDIYAIQAILTNGSGFGVSLTIQIAIGAAGAEVALGEFNQSLSAGGTSTNTFVVPLALKQGQRVAWRVKNSGGDTNTMTLKLVYVSKADMA